MALVVVGVLGCGGADGGAVLFSEDFAGSFPAPNWSGEGTVNPASGAPAPSLRLAPTPPLALATMQAINPVTVGSGLLFRFSAALPAGSSGQIFLNDAQPSGQPLAYVNFRGGGDIEFNINGLSSALQPTGGHDGQFHELELQFSDGGASSWSRDGAVQLQGKGISPAMLARIFIQTSAPAGLSIDEVEIQAR